MLILGILHGRRREREGEIGRRRREREIEGEKKEREGEERERVKSDLAHDGGRSLSAAILLFSMKTNGEGGRGGGMHNFA